MRLVTLPEDVRLVELSKEKIHGILAAPPCTHFAGSGARWWKGKGDAALLEGLSVVDACIRIIQFTKPDWWVLENPAGRLSRYIGRPVMTFNPCDYGDPYTKRTCLWGKFIEPVKSPVEPEFVYASNGDKYSKIHMKTGGTSAKTKELRSITPQGFAKAFFKANP